MSRALLSLVLPRPASHRPPRHARANREAPAPWSTERPSGDVSRVADLEIRLVLLQDQLVLVDAGESSVGLERRVAQCRAALERCRRCDFGPEMRRFLELKIAKLEQELSRAVGGDSSGVFSFFR